MAAKPIPDGYHTVTPYLIVSNAAAAIEFYKRAFSAKELMRMLAPDGKVGHAEVQIGDSRIMLADEFPEMGFRGPQLLDGTAGQLRCGLGGDHRRRRTLDTLYVLSADFERF